MTVHEFLAAAADRLDRLAASSYDACGNLVGGWDDLTYTVVTDDRREDERQTVRLMLSVLAQLAEEVDAVPEPTSAMAKAFAELVELGVLRVRVEVA